MLSYIILLLGFLFFSIFSFSLNTIFFIIIVTLSLFLKFDFSQIAFILNKNFIHLVTKPEIISIPFFLMSSEILLNTGFTKKFKNSVFRFLGVNIIGYLVYFISICTSISSSVIFSRVLTNDFKDDEYQDRKSLIRGHFFLSAINYITPISIPLIIVTSILKISLKKSIMFSFMYIAVILIIYYFIFFSKKFKPKATTEARFFDIIPIVGYCIILYGLIYITSLPIDTVAQVLFLYTILIAFLSKKVNVRLIENTTKNAFIRSGIIISVIYFINVFNFFSIYTDSSKALIDNLAILFSESGFILVFVYILAYFLIEVIDPLGVILLLFPIYNNLLTLYGINNYAFLISFIIFVSVGLIGKIEELPGSIIRKKYSLNTFDINDMILLDFILLMIFSFGVYFVI